MAWTMASQQFLVPSPRCVCRRYCVVSSETVASRTFDVRRRRVSPHGRFKAAGEALAIQETMESRLSPSAMMRTTAWRAHTSSSLDHSWRPPFDVGGPTVLLPSPAQKESEGAVARKTSAIFLLALSSARGGRLFGDGSWRFFEEGGGGLGSWPSFARVVAWSSLR